MFPIYIVEMTSVLQMHVTERTVAHWLHLIINFAVPPALCLHI